MGNFDIEKLANLVCKKRADKNLREIATQIGNISPSTISRIENGKMPNLENFLSRKAAMLEAAMLKGKLKTCSLPRPFAQRLQELGVRV